MKKFLATVILLPILLVSAACGNEKPIPDPDAIAAAALVIGNHANAQRPVIDLDDALQDEDGDFWDTMINGRGFISLTIVDGKPITDSSELALPKPSQNMRQREQDVKNFKRNVLFLAQNAYASSDEVDTLKAIQEASKALRSKRYLANASKQIIVYDTGLSTKGTLNFLKDRRYLSDPNLDPMADVDSIIAQLKKDKAISPTLLQGITVRWYGLGSVADPQNPLTDAQRTQLEEIWGAVLDACGAEYFDIIQPTNNGSNAGRNQDDEAEETGEERQAQNGVVENDDLPQYPKVTTICFPIIFDGSAISFKGNSTEFTDPDLAMAALTEVKSYLEQHDDIKIIIAGTTATGDADNCRQLSKDRADTIKDTLIFLGVSTEQIKHTIGLGFNNSFHFPDDPNNSGRFENENLALPNRKAIIMDASSPEAIALLS